MEDTGPVRIIEDGIIWTVNSTVLSEDALKSLGLVAYWAAWLEANLELIVIRLIKTDTHIRGRAVVGDLMANNLVEMARRLIKISPEVDDSLADALSQAKSALVHRNEVLHGSMSGSLEDGSVTLNSRKQRAQRALQETEIAAVAQELFVAAMKLSEFV